MPYVAAVFDCNEEPWRSLNYGHAQQAMCDWLTLHDVDYMLCHRVEVLADGDGQLVAHCFDPAILTDTCCPTHGTSSPNAMGCTLTQTGRAAP